MKKWNIASPSQETVNSLCQSGIDPLAAHLLAARGYETVSQASDFLQGGETLSDPYLLLDMDKAVERISEAVEYGQRICIYGDYDCDGITATVLLYTYLQNIGADVYYYIPDRDGEGYGMNMAAIHALSAKGTDLIITVDNGISALEEIAYATRLGMDVVVTDHHQPRSTLPGCTAVVDPHRKDQQEVFKDLAGVGVAFKLICAMEQDDGSEMLEYYSDLVTLGTVADVVPLKEENRCIVRHGLENLPYTQNTGLRALMKACGLEDKPMSATAVAFVLSPRINAAGRLGQVEKAIELLLCEDEETAQVLSEEICAMNKERQALEADILKDVAQQLQKNPGMLHDRVLLIRGKGWHHGVIGIVCARVAEKFGKPCILFSEEDGELRGSGRSVDGFDLIGCISLSADLLDRYGGHPAAAGLTLQADVFEEFCRQMQKDAAEKYPYMPVTSLHIDKAVTAGEVTVEGLRRLQALEPFGAGNEPPVLAYLSCRLEGVYVMGNGKHLRLKLSQNGQNFYAVYFNMAPEAFPYQVGDTVDIAANCDINFYQNQEQVSVKIRDMRLSGFDQDRYFEGREQYDRFCREEGFLPDCADRSVPDRGNIADIYRGLRDKGGFTGDYDSLYLRLATDEINYCAFRIGMDVLIERGLVTYTREKGVWRFVLPVMTKKVDLNESPVMKKLQLIKG